jgi:hypothetical protein
MVETGQWMTLAGRFGLDQDQASCIFSYANQQAMYSPYQAYGNMMAQGILKSKSTLKEFFPINLAARTMAYRIYNGIMADETAGVNVAGQNGTAVCCSMVAEAVLNDTLVVEICTGQNFTNIENLQEWISPFWYQDYTEFMAKTGMTLPEVTTFYSNATALSFGVELQQALT